MVKRSFPKRPGLYWASFDDTDAVTEVSPVFIAPYSGQEDLTHGGVCTLQDGSSRQFEFAPDSNVVRIVKPVSLGFVATFVHLETWRITWHGPVTPPARVPEVGTALVVP